MALYQAAINKSFNDGWLARKGDIQLYEEAGHIAGRAVGQAEEERMETIMANVARSAGSAHGYASRYKAARQDSLNDLTSALEIKEIAMVEKVVAEATTALQLAEDAL